MKRIADPAVAKMHILAGDIIAYPTEAVYGLGCNPFLEESVERLMQLKVRSTSKGVILLIAEWSQLFALIQPVDDRLLEPVRKTWPGPVTWIFPKSAAISPLISGAHETVAIRMTAHPVARALCLDLPLVSTSANISGQLPATDYAALEAQFPEGIDVFYEGELGGRSTPSAIFDLLTGQQLR